MGADTEEKTGRKRKPRIYMETTMFNYYFDEERGEHHKYTIKLFKMIKDGVFEAYTSYYVTSELEDAEEPKRNRMLDLIEEYGMTVLDENEEIRRMGKLYVEKCIIPQKYLADALHIATATVYDLDAIISMNFEHIVKQKTIRMAGVINVENGYNAIEICSPKEAVEK